MNTPDPEGGWSEVSQASLAARMAAIVRRLRGEASPPSEDAGGALGRLADLFGLTHFELDVLACLAGRETDAQLGKAVAALDDAPGPGVARDILLRVSAAPHWSALLPGGVLREWELVEELDGGRLAISSRILSFLLGVDALPRELEDGLRSWTVRPCHPEDDALAERAVASVAASGRAGNSLPYIELVGSLGSRGRAIAASVARQAGLGVLPLDAERFLSDPRAFRLAVREAVLRGCALVLEQAAGGVDPRPLLARPVSEPVLVVLLSEDRIDARGLARSRVTVEIPPRSWEARLAPWLDRLPSTPDVARQLASRFALDDAAIDGVVERAAHQPGDRVTALWAEAREAARVDLGALAHRAPGRPGWDQLVVTERVRRELVRVTRLVRTQSVVEHDLGLAASGRDRGIAVLFSGVSGTGKSLAAEVLAADLGLDLFVVDLSAVVSKYIGETERNLRRLFEGVERSGAALLFDECDALFGQRGEVNDSHDRYANIEVSYLLQRIERSSAVVFLTTNLKDNIDPAFTRRFRAVVEFEFPDRGLRRTLWERHLPARLRGPDVDLDRLAELDLTGAGIRSVVLDAASVVAGDGRVTLESADLLASARAEFERAGRGVPVALFGEGTP